jgi:uncharacterized protein YbjQ (UPF0145 family)
MRKILVTTTELLSGWEIESYIKPLFANVVIGTNIFSDFSASLTDIFGGRSSSYEKKLQSLNDNALQILKSKASELGANCIIGLKINSQQINGKNVQMFMVSAYGTAVIARNFTTKNAGSILTKELDKSTVLDKAFLIKLLGDFKNDDFKLTMDALEFIVESKTEDFAPMILKKLRQSSLNEFPDETQLQAKKLFVDYFAAINPQKSIDILYDALMVESDERFKKDILIILKTYDLVDFERCINILESEDLAKRKLALEILRYDKSTYVTDDIDKLENVALKIENSFPLISNVTTKKGFLSSSEKELWLCKCSQSNKLSTIYCNNCQNDQRGFRTDELQPIRIINQLKYKSQALKEIFR